MPRPSYMLPNWLGLNTEVAPEVCPPGAMVLCENWEPWAPARLRRRLGSTRWGPAGTNAIQRFAFLRGGDGDPDFIVAVTDSGALYGDVRSSWPPTSWVGVTGSAGVSFSTKGEEAVFQDNIFLANSMPVRMITDELEFRTAYLDPPDTSVRGNVSTTAGMTGTYDYVYTYRAGRRAFGGASIIESNPCPVGTAVATTAKALVVATMGVSQDADALPKYLYRKKSTETVWYFVAEVPNSATAWEDTKADANVGEGTEEGAWVRTTPEELVSSPHHICVHRNRLFAAADGFEVAFTEVEQPCYWGFSTSSGLGTNLLKLSAEQSEGYITGLVSSFDALLALTRQGMWEVSGDALENFAIRKVANVGCIAPQSVAVSAYGVFFLSERGVELWDGQTATEVSKPIRSDLRAELDTSARGVWYNDAYFLRTQSGKVWQYFADTQAWSVATMATNAWERNHFLPMLRNETVALFGVSQFHTAQLVNLLAVGIHTDEGQQIEGDAKSGYTDLGVPFKFKSAAVVQVEAHTVATTANELQVTFTAGPHGSASSAAISVSTDAYEYGFGLPSGAVATTFQLRFQFSGAQDCELHRVNVEYSAREASLR